MNLEDKEKLELQDSHLWALGSKIKADVMVKNLPSLLVFLESFSIKLRPHLNYRSQEQLWVAVELSPEEMEQDKTGKAINDLIQFLFQLNGSKPTFLYDGWEVSITKELLITDRWREERRD